MTARRLFAARPADPGCARLPRVAALALVGLAGLLAGCGGPDPDRFAPVCPVPVLLRDAADLHRFRGAGRDITDSTLDGRITGVSGSCTRDGADMVVATIAVGIDLTRGPATTARTSDVSYFVDVVDGERIRDRAVYTLHAEFPPNTDRLRLVGDELELRLPITPQKTAAAYKIYVGFQLTPAEVEINRARPRR